MPLVSRSSGSLDARASWGRDRGRSASADRDGPRKTTDESNRYINTRPREKPSANPRKSRTSNSSNRRGAVPFDRARGTTGPARGRRPDGPVATKRPRSSGAAGLAGSLARRSTDRAGSQRGRARAGRGDVRERAASVGSSAGAMDVARFGARISARFGGSPAPRLRALPAMPPSCPVCASTTVTTDEVAQTGGSLRLSECLHRDHR